MAFHFSLERGKKMNKLDILKGGTELLVSMGVGAIVGNVIKMTADPEQGRIKKIATGLGGFVISSMITDKAVVYSNDRIDNIAETVRKLKRAAKTLPDVEVTVEIKQEEESDK